MKLLIFGLFIANCSLFAVSFFLVFRSHPEKRIIEYRVLQILSVGAYFVFAYLIFVKENVVFVVSFISALLLFVSAGLLIFTAHYLRQLKLRLTLIFSEDLPEFILCDGPYKLVRNPFYSSYLASYLAAAIYSNTIFGYLYLLAMVALYLDAIFHEEKKFDESDLSNQFDEYKRRTPKLIPTPKSLKRKVMTRDQI